MNDFIRLLALGAATFSLGIGFTLAGLFTMSRRYGSNSDVEGCFTNFLVLITVGIAAFFFYVAVMR